MYSEYHVLQYNDENLALANMTKCELQHDVMTRPH